MYATSGTKRMTAAWMLFTMNEGVVDAASGRHFSDEDQLHLDHFFPISKAVTKDGEITQNFKALWHKAFDKLPVDKRPPADPNSIINLRFCDDIENMSKGDSLPPEEEIIRLWQVNYNNIAKHEIPILSKTALAEFNPYDYGILDDTAQAHFDHDEHIAYHMWSIYEALSLAIELADQSGVAAQEIGGFFIEDHLPHLRDYNLPTLKQGNIHPFRLAANGESQCFREEADRLHAAGVRITRGFSGSVIEVNNTTRRWLKLYEQDVMGDAFTSHLINTLGDIRELMATKAGRPVIFLDADVA